MMTTGMTFKGQHSQLIAIDTLKQSNEIGILVGDATLYMSNVLRKYIFKIF